MLPTHRTPPLEAFAVNAATKATQTVSEDDRFTGFPGASPRVSKRELSCFRSETTVKNEFCLELPFSYFKLFAKHSY